MTEPTLPASEIPGIKALLAQDAIVGELAMAPPPQDPKAENDHVMRSLFIKDVFEPDDYARILALPQDPELSSRFLAHERQLMSGYAQYMHCQSYLPALNADSAWLIEHLRRLLEVVNRRYYHFACQRVLGTQILSLEAGQQLDWHMGTGSGLFATRKLGLIAFLTPLDQYSGGVFEVMASTYRGDRREQGWVGFFPAFAVTRIQAVSSGRMQVLLTWMHGPAPFC
ncbi:MAG: hypothetical protein CVV27_07470 [Candidatus Melainabacteria bacterium HGW-Melainabacteria-1]|nr:MAG: hypothetical protein CVV27_07470 [Candidatus Melainabacteria bacterium HGW-Melainabacteria-1]